MTELWLYVTFLSVCLLTAALYFVQRAGRPGGATGAHNLGRNFGSNYSRKQSNASLYREREADIEAQYRDGIIGADERSSLLDELRDRVLADVQADTTASVSVEPAGRGRIAIFIAVLLAPLLALLLYLPQGMALGGSLDWQLSQRLESLRNSDDAAARQRELAALAAQLAAFPRQLAKRDDLRALQAQAYSGSGQHQRAAVAYRQLLATADAGMPDGRRADTYALLAQSLYFAAGQQFSEEARNALQRALALDAGQPLALGLSGIAAYQRGEYPVAVDHWQAALQRYPAGAAQRVVLERSIDAARAAQRTAGVEPGSASGATTVAGDRASGPFIEVAVSIDATLLRKKDAPQTPVFVFARAPAGPPMPLAAKRLQLGDLPAQLTLGPADAVMGRSLADVEVVQVVARLARSGEPAAKAGDIEGTTPEPVRLSGQRAEVAVHIDTLLE